MKNLLNKMMVLALIALTSQSVFAAKVMCAVQAESKPNEWSTPLAYVEITSENQTLLLQEGDIYYTATVNDDSISVYAFNRKDQTILAMAQAQDTKNILTLVPSTRRMIVCSKSE